MKGTSSPSGDAKHLSPERALQIYRMMLLIRRFEERVAECFAAAEIPGFIHLCVGQEAIAAAVCAGLRDDDLVSATHRGHGQCLAKGAEPGPLMAELFGRASGYCHGKGGSMHACDMSHGVLGTNGIVGGNLPIAVGTALAAQVRRSGQVSVCFFGDGASNIGAAHEAMNLASVWDLPVVFVCENNLYAEFTPQSAQTKLSSIANRAVAYGMAGVSMDGNDAVAVYEVARDAIDRARNGAGPTLIEARTYRWRGHHEGDAMSYRPKGELEVWRAKDPIPRLRTWLLEHDILTADSDQKLVAAVQAEVDGATEFARHSAWPAPDAVLEGVYA